MRIQRNLTCALAFVGLWACSTTANAELLTIFSFSQTSSEVGETDDIPTDPADISPVFVGFDLSGSTLTITVDNRTDYEIASLYFNSDTLTGLTPQLSGPTATVKDTEKANGFGTYDWELDWLAGGSMLAANTVSTVSFTIQGSISETTLMQESTIPPGSEIYMAAMKFQAGPNGDSAFGATSLTVEEIPPPTPEPSSLLLAVLGAIGVPAFARRRRRKQSENAAA